jgi:hypothetical protein
MGPRCRSRMLCILSIFVCANVFAQAPHTVSVWPQKPQLGIIVKIQTDNVSSFVKPDPSGKLPSGLVPYMGDVALKGSMLENYDPKTGIFRFTLLRNSGDAASKEAWTHVLSGVGRLNGQGNYNKRITIGRETEGAVPAINSNKETDPRRFELVVFPQPWSTISVILFVLFLQILFLFGNTLKNSAPRGEGLQTFSRGKCQMAWWTVIVLSSFTFVWLVTGSYAMPASSLVRLGVSSATALGAVLSQPKPDREESPDRFALRSRRTDAPSVPDVCLDDCPRHYLFSQRNQRTDAADLRSDSADVDGHQFGSLRRI